MPTNEMLPEFNGFIITEPDWHSAKQRSLFDMRNYNAYLKKHYQ